MLSQSRVSRFMSMVREAFVTSVAWTPSSVAPVRCHRIHVSNVPNMHFPSSTASRIDGTFSISHLHLMALKQLLNGNPHIDFRKLFLLWFFANMVFSSVLVRQSFHARITLKIQLHLIGYLVPAANLPMALYNGLPVSLFQSIVVSRWLVTAKAMISFGFMSKMIRLRTAPSMHSPTFCQISSGSNSTQSDCVLISFSWTSWHVSTSALRAA